MSETKKESCVLHAYENGLCEIVFDAPGAKVNKLDRQTMAAFQDCVKQVASNGRIRGVLIRSGKEGQFIAGADINIIGSVREIAEARKLSWGLQAIFDELSALSVPVVCAIEGPCLGGGLELALACSHRVASNHEKTQIGLPEVNLGVIPGAGGTQRLPRLIGIRAALPMILTGKPVGAEKALKLGIVDRVFPSQFFVEMSWEYLKALVGKPKRMRKGRLFERPLEAFRVGRNFMFKKASEQVLASTKGFYPAPLRAIEAIRVGFEKGMAEGLRKEADFFGELAVSSVCKNLIRIFFATEAVKKDTGLSQEVGQTMSAWPLERIGVLGAGIMGGGIAQLAAAKGIQVRMKDINHDAIQLGLGQAREIFEKAVRKKKMSQGEMYRAMQLISPTLEYKGFKSAEIVIEAVVENLDVKKKVFADIEKAAGEKTILATNTSSLSVTAIGERCRDRSRVAGLHFFNPVNLMPLVEVIRGEGTSDETIYQLVAFSKKIGKVPIVVKDRPGFLVNRILCPYLNEAGFLFVDGASVKAIDDAAVRFGMPMGPFRLLDEIGLDTALHVSQILERELGPRLHPVSLVREMVELGCLGKKNGKGFYLYKGMKEAGLNPEVPKATKVLEDEQVILDRLILVMVNEASRCIDEEIVRENWMIDMAMVMGTGFPPFRGGILQYADDRGIGEVVQRLEKFAAQFGERFTPTDRLKEMRLQNRKFYS